MNTVDKNTPAFPTTEEHGFNSGSPGMTLRDHFAGQALVGLMGRSWDMGRSWEPLTGEELMKTLASSSYLMADYMMLARNAEAPPA